MLSKNEGDRIKICCVGDSLTYGNVGYSYIHFFNENIDAKNKGVNGETLRGAYKRLENILENPNSDYDIYIVEIGANDVLLPYLKTVSPFWFLMMGVRCKVKKCIEDDDVFYDEYIKLLELFSERSENVIVLGLPILNFKNFPQQKVVKRNEIISEIARKHDYPFIDIYNLQAENIEAESYEYSWKFGFLMRCLDAIIMTLFPFTKDWFSKLRGLNMTVDGAHLNSTSAKLVASSIEKVIYKEL